MRTSELDNFNIADRLKEIQKEEDRAAAQDFSSSAKQVSGEVTIGNPKNKNGREFLQFLELDKVPAGASGIAIMLKPDTSKGWKYVTQGAWTKCSTCHYQRKPNEVPTGCSCLDGGEYRIVWLAVCNN